MTTAHSVHFRWWKLSRIVLSIREDPPSVENRERGTITERSRARGRRRRPRVASVPAPESRRLPEKEVLGVAGHGLSYAISLCKSGGLCPSGSPTSPWDRTSTGSSFPSSASGRSGVVLAVLLVAGAVGYFLYTRSRRTPEEKARVEIASATPCSRARPRPRGAARPGSHLAQARDALRSSETAFGGRRFDEAFRLAVESQSYSRRALGGAGTEETGDASFISIEGDVSLQSAGRSIFEPARQRQALFDGDFVKTGRNGLGRDHVRRRDPLHAAPRLALRGAPPVALGIGGQPGQDRVGRDQRLHGRVDLEDRDRRRDGRRGPRLPRGAGRREGREDRGHELPRQDHRFDRPRNGRPVGTASGSRRRRAPARSPPRSSFPRRRSRCCRPTTGSTT